MTRAEKYLIDWQYRKAGSFVTKLFECMTLADEANLSRLGEGFPEEVRAYKRFHEEKDYWDNLKKEAFINE